MSAPFPSGKLPTTRVRRLISRLSRSIMLFYSSRYLFCGGLENPPFSRAGRAGGLTCGATMARLGPRYGSGRFSLRATSSRVEGDGLAGNGRSAHGVVPRVCSAQVFSFGSQQSQPPYRKRIAANTGRPSAKVPPDPSEKRHTNAYGCHESPFEPSINSLIHRQEVKERSSVGWVRRRNRQNPAGIPPPGVRQRTAPAPP